MFGAVHFGIMAALVVLFVPMGLAGWHLSRNKVLFFSGILFIALFVGVHLSPYFTSVSSFVNTFPTASSSVPVLYEQEDNICMSVLQLHHVKYKFDSGKKAGPLNDSRVPEDLSWHWDNHSLCEFHKLSKVDASDLLNGSWVVVAGDSQARLFVVSLLDLVLGPEKMESVRGDLFKRHSNYQAVIDGIGLKLDFLWAPYARNLTEIIMEFMGNKTYPDVLVIGAGLWDMLRITNSTEYGSSLQQLNTYLVSSLPVSPEYRTSDPITGTVPVPTPHFFWLGSPTLINRMLNTEEKKVKMTDAMYAAYEREMYQSKLLRQSGGPAFLLDIKLLSQKCGDRCTEDGMHYNNAVYETAVHIMLNALIIESQQKL
ncbi:protein ALTERED XYLOGLUCAN 9 [Apium graveolens]|uniref:protein ALTERED XYLOGLUCAN 9 n=1 Tax=Apium graveolens TaxID=4045 RepID=UPI003D7A645C